MLNSEAGKGEPTKGRREQKKIAIHCVLFAFFPAGRNAGVILHVSGPKLGSSQNPAFLPEIS